MKYIEKDYSTPVVIRHQQELKKHLLDEQSLLDPKNHVGLTGKKLYKLVRDIKIIPHFWDLKHQMYLEQGGICCYCGLKIFESDEGRRMAVEHVIPKDSHRELVGEYKNLLLSCTNEDDDATLMGVAPNDSSLRHCDTSKSNNVLNNSPLLRDCETLFLYDSVGKVLGADQSVEEDIQTLGLNCDFLVSRRKEALNILFDDDDNLISEEELRKIATNIMQPDTEGMLCEFCFVIKQVVDSFI